MPASIRFIAAGVVLAALAAAVAAAEPGPPATEPPASAASAAAAPAWIHGPWALPVVKEPVRLGRHFPAWAQEEMLGTAVWQFIAAFLFLLAGLALKKVSGFLFEKKIVPFLETTHFQFDNLLASSASKPLGCLLLLGGATAAVWVLDLPEAPTDVRSLAFGAIKILFTLDVMWFFFRSVDVLAQYLARLAGHTQSQLDDQLVPLLRKVLKVAIGVVLGVWVVQLFGYSVSSLLAGLGIGGLAVALALQDTLSNFFGSVVIFMDHPFGVGDVVRIDDVEGAVEQIGFRSTRLRTAAGTLVSIPNKIVATTKIDNGSRLPKRRVLQTVGLTYDTTAGRMVEATAAIRRLLEADPGVDPESILVEFDEFGASSLDIKIVYFTRAVPYAEHMATKGRVNLAILSALTAMGLSMAFPTRTVYLRNN